MNKPQGVCIFCDNPAHSKEHVWPEWMHPLLHTTKGMTHNRYTITKWPNGLERTDGPTDRQGGVTTIKVRCVCDPCNNGWMNRLEGAVRPFLGRMVLGEDNVVLSKLQILALAKWCALKFLIMEHASSGTSVTPKPDRIAFKEHGAIPPYFRIYVGNHASKHRSGLMRQTRVLALSREGPKPALDGTGRNVQTTTILLGRLFIHLNAARIDNFEIEQVYFVSRVWRECQIWPTPILRRKWPHRPLLDDSGLSMIARSLEEIAASKNVKWVDDIP